jgi:DNA-binding NarL/FixJ family response regulator
VGRISCPDFVGRVEESRALDKTLESATGGAAATVFVGGEAGIGKSRLVAEFSRRAGNRGARVLTGGCAPIGSDPLPFAPVVEALRAFMRSAEASERARLAGRAPALAWLLPELGAKEGTWRRREGSESGQGRVFELLLGVLEDLAGERPLVLVLEDLHWADRSTLDLLALRTQTARIVGCAVVGTYRTDELGPGHALRLLLAELDRTRRTERLELRRFGRAELVAQLTGILGAPPRFELAEDVLLRSDGNPFLAEELLAASDEAHVGAPTKVRDIVLARVETLSDRSRRVLRILSAARHSLDHHALAAISGMAAPQLEACLREALERHVLVRTEAAAYAFRHALTREAIYDGLLPGERERLHLELARALDARRTMAGTATPELLADRAHHWYRAGDGRRALESAVEAGRSVDEIYAHAEALTQYERALELWEHVGDAERLAGMDRVALRARAAEAASSLGEPAHAARTIERALEEVDVAADPVRAGLLHERLGRYSWLGGDTAQALAAYENAVRIIPGSPPSRERARAVAALGHAQYIANRYRIARELGAGGLEIARAAKAPVEEACALATLGAATAGLGGDGLEMVLEGRALLERAGAAPDFVFVTYAYESSLLADAADFEASARAARAGISFTARHGMHRNHRSWLDGQLALSMIKLGRWTEADEILNAAILRGPSGITRRMVLLLRAELALARGDLAAATAGVRDAHAAVLGDQPFTGKLFELTTALAIARHDYDSARSQVEQGLVILVALDDPRAIACLCRRGMEAEADRAERLRARRQRADAMPAVASATGLRDRLSRLAARESARSSPEIPAMAATCDAELERAAGRPAADAWLTAAEAWRALHEPHPRARCLIHAAEAALADRRPRNAVAATLTTAHEIAGDLGAVPLVHEIESIARRGRVTIGGREPEPPEPAPTGAPLGLTPREIEVLRLVGNGYTNGQIASALYISRKTAGAHVSNILRKLGAGRRAEAAAIAGRLDLLDEPTR